MDSELAQDISYRFSCTLCGDCCRGRQAVALNRQDLILLANHLAMDNTAELFSHGLVELRRGDNGHWRPYIRFRRRPIRMCPFLQNEVAESGFLLGKCKMHSDDKPLVCHLAPLGRVLDLENNHEQWQVNEPSPGCPGMGQGEPRRLSRDLVPFRERLDDEARFFADIEVLSPSCPNETVAISRMFSFAVIPSQPKNID